MSAILVDEGVRRVPDPTKTVTFSRCRVKQLHIVEDGFGGVFKKNLTVTILQRGDQRQQNSNILR